MNQSFSFVVSPSDWNAITLYSSPRWTTIARLVFSVSILVLAIRGLLLRGPDSGFWMQAGVAMLLLPVMGLPNLVMASILLIVRPRVTIDVDDSRVVFNARKYREEIPWNSFSMYGHAAEYRHHFWLEFGRGAVWIPKRALPSAGQLVEFREVLARKLGSRFRQSVARE